MTTDTSSGAAGEPPQRSGRSSRPPGPGRTSASSSTSSTEVGWVGKAHGLDGAFRVTRPESLRVGLQTSLGRITDVFGTPQKPVIRVAGITSIAQAEGLRGTPLVVERDAIGLEEGEIWAEDLVGRRVVAGDVELGVVDRVVSYPSCEVLVVGERLIPFVDDAVPTVGEVIEVNLEFLGES